MDEIDGILVDPGFIRVLIVSHRSKESWSLRCVLIKAQMLLLGTVATIGQYGYLLLDCGEDLIAMAFNRKAQRRDE